MNWNKKDTIRILLILCGVVLFAYVLFNFDKVSSLFSWLVNILMPFVIGFAIAFVVNVPMKGLEKVLFKNENSRLYRFKRPACLILSFLCIIAVFTFAITMIIPEMSKTITAFADKLPDAMDDIQRKAIKLMKDHPEIVDKIKSININWDSVISNVVGIVKNGGSSVLSSTFSIASSVVGGFVDVLVGIFFACYILAQKETLEKQVKGILYAVFKEDKADRFVQTCVLADRTFSKFISGQCLEACILGLMFFITMTIFRIPYALTVSIIIAVFALIPAIGAFVGCFAGAIMILVENPKQAIIFLIIFIVLQQIEGNFIYPHVVGGSVGLPSIWVLVCGFSSAVAPSAGCQSSRLVSGNHSPVSPVCSLNFWVSCLPYSHPHYRMLYFIFCPVYKLFILFSAMHLIKQIFLRKLRIELLHCPCPVRVRSHRFECYRRHPGLPVPVEEYIQFTAAYPGKYHHLHVEFSAVTFFQTGSAGIFHTV